MPLNILISLPEIIFLLMIVLTLLVDLFVPQRQQSMTFAFALLSLIAAAAASLFLHDVPRTLAFNDMYVHSNMTNLLKLFIYLISFFALIYSRTYIKDRNIHQGEYYILTLFSVLGMMVLISANSLLVLFLGLELLSLPIYAMVAMQRNSARASEAAIKYFVIGGLASGILLYGISMIYGATNSLNISQIAISINQTSISGQVLLIFGLVFVITGIFFKLGAAPFHMWAPDVYEGAPTSVTLFLGTAPKIAAFALIIRLLVDAMPALNHQWQQVIIVIAIASMAWGNIVAIVQTNFKRMLAYSSIAHMGYMSLGILVATPSGYSSAMFYILIYAIMSLGAFAILAILSKANIEIEKIGDLRGLNSRNPWLALMMLLLMFSMAGVPPTVGFFAKLGVLEALVDAHFIWLAALALLFAVIGAYYYLAVVKVMYFEEPVDHTAFHVSKDTLIAVSINSLAVLVLGFFPTYMIDLCRQAFGF